MTIEEQAARNNLKRLGLSFFPPKGFDLARAHGYTDVANAMGTTQTPNRVARWDRLTEELGGREEVIRCLEFVDQPAAQLLLTALQHPEYDLRSMAFIAFGCRVTEAQFRTLVTHGLKQKNRYDAARATAPKIHGVVSGLGDDAMPREVKCPDCKGLGELVEEDGGSGTCSNCDGSGKVRQAANVKKQELFLRQAGLIEEGGGVHVTTSVTMQAAIGSMPSLEDVVRAGKGGIVSIERVE